MSNIRQHLQNRLSYLIVAGLLLRLLLIVIRFDEFADDRDAYLGIANNLLQGVGFSTSGTDYPTAFRPPLYPSLLAFFTGVFGTIGIAILHLVAGGVSIWATVKLGERLGLKEGALLAGLLVAIDPILLRYTTLPMTEVIFAALTTLMLWLWNRADQRPSWNAYLLTGFTFGIAALCRPSLLPMLAVLWVLYLMNDLTSFHRAERIIKSTLCIVLVGASAMITMLPWGTRNLAVFGHFKLTTTHGGYTLLLGNNPVFYDAVVRQPLGTTWGDYAADDVRSQTSWINKLNRQLDERGLVSEFDRDHAQYDRAIKNIQAEPLMFLRASLLREIRFWSPVPIGPQARSMNSVIYWGTALFYVLVYLLALLGVISIFYKSENRRRLWLPALAMIITFSVVHSLYWSNARMRAPLIPVIAILAAYGLENRRAGGVNPLVTLLDN